MKFRPTEIPPEAIAAMVYSYFNATKAHVRKSCATACPVIS
jgi:hypothetical protein